VSAIYGAATTQMLMIGNTDTKHYWDVCQNIYRFSAINIDIKDVAMFHGVNERVSVENLLNLSRFYRDLMERVLF
jgi:carboxypeptidase PM20D1